MSVVDFDLNQSSIALSFGLQHPSCTPVWRYARHMPALEVWLAHGSVTARIVPPTLFPPLFGPALCPNLFTAGLIFPVHSPKHCSNISTAPR